MKEFNIKITDDEVYINNKLHNFANDMDKENKEDDLNKKAILALANEMGYEAVFLFEEMADRLHEMIDEDCNCEEGISPILCESERGSIHHHHFACPICKNKVGGFLSTGSGENDWGTHQDKFCSECGQEINWGDTNFVDIYQV